MVTPVASRDARGGHARLLYHYTDEPGFAELLRLGVLPPAELVIRHRHLHLKQALSWLTDDPDPGSPAVRTVARLRHGAQVAVRLSIACTDAQRWPRWTLDHRVGRRDAVRVEQACDGLSDRLWVVPHAIPSAQWMIAEDPFTRAVLWRNEVRTAS
jgi:hypothetical protein